MSDKPIEEMTFEQAMAELEAVVDQLDRGEVALDESIKSSYKLLSQNYQTNL